MNIISIALLVNLSAIVSGAAYSGRYGDGGFSSGSGSGLITGVLAMACVVFAYGKLYEVYTTPHEKDPLNGIGVHFVGYAILAFFLIPPPLLLIKLIFGVTAVKYLFLPVWFGVAAVITLTTRPD